MQVTETLTMARIESLFSGYGARLYGGEAITQTEHALQCALLAEAAGESEAVIVAALLHDIGHLLQSEDDTIDHRHQEVGAQALAGVFGDAVIDPVRLHVAAKRYLCWMDASYHAGLSQASKDSLVRQGGPYSDSQAAAFFRSPHAEEAVRVRQYDDLAKVVGKLTPPLSYYLRMVAAQFQARH